MAKKRKKQDTSLMKTRDKILLPVLLAAAIGAAVLTANYRSFLRDREYDDLLSLDVMYNNIFVNNYEVAGLTKEQALEKLERELQDKKFDKKCIYLMLPRGRTDEAIPITYKEMGMRYDFEPAVEEAYSYARTGSAAQRIEAIDELEYRGQFFTALYSHDRDMIISALKSHEAEINARFENGEKMDIERTADM
ncbi:MAG: hypothetical protein IJL89_05860, partial [Firmicutes bacterium]|nr:hypothetical protein [Bacillota bacterium]